MDFAWTTEQSDLHGAVVRFAQCELNRDVRRADSLSEFDRDGWRKCGEFGIQGLPIPSLYGGRGTDPLTMLHVLEGLGYGCRDNGLTFAIGAHVWGCALPLSLFGTTEQKEYYLPRLCSGEWVGALAMSERDAGSDAYSLQTLARRDGDSYVLNGSKMFVTNGPIADIFLVCATIDPTKGSFGITSFLVERDTPGLRVGVPIDKMGLRTAPMSEVVLADCVVPAANRLGKEGAGLSLFTHAMEWERGFILAPVVGAMERQLQTCVEYVKQRHQFNRPIGQFQHISGLIVGMRLRLETAKMLLYKVGWLKSTGRSALEAAAMAKLVISEGWVQSCKDALQIHGGYGYLSEFELERDVRDAYGSLLYSGTSQIQQVIIAQMMGLPA